VFNGGARRLLVDAVDMRDYPVIQGSADVFARVHPDQPDRRRALRFIQSEDPVTGNDDETTRRSTRCPRAPLVADEHYATPWSDLAQFKRQKVAMVAGAFVILLVVVAIAAPDRASTRRFFDYDQLNRGRAQALVRRHATRTRHLQPHRHGCGFSLAAVFSRWPSCRHRNTARRLPRYNEGWWTDHHAESVMSCSRSRDPARDRRRRDPR